MAKIKELLAGREKMKKYDELTEWKRLFEEGNTKLEQAHFYAESTMISCGTTTFEIPDHIKEIIVSALDAEIAKLDEE